MKASSPWQTSSHLILKPHKFLITLILYHEQGGLVASDPGRGQPFYICLQGTRDIKPPVWYRLGREGYLLPPPPNEPLLPLAKEPMLLNPMLLPEDWLNDIELPDAEPNDLWLNVLPPE